MPRNADIVAFLGSIRSTQIHAMAPDILKTAKPVVFGGTDPSSRKLGNPWLFRFRPNDAYSGRVIADYGVKTLGQEELGDRALDRRVRHERHEGADGRAQASSAQTVALDQGYANQSQDFTAVVLAIKQSGADVIGSYFTFENDLGIFARQLRQLGVTIPWVGSPSIVNVNALKLAGAGALRHLRRRRLRRGFEPGGEGIRRRYIEAAMNVEPDNYVVLDL